MLVGLSTFSMNARQNPHSIYCAALIILSHSTSSTETPLEDIWFKSITLLIQSCVLSCRDHDRRYVYHADAMSSSLDTTILNVLS